MIVVEEFTTKFEVELVAKLSDTLLNVFGLNFNVFVVVEAVFHNFQIVRMQIKIRGTNLVFFSLIANIRRKKSKPTAPKSSAKKKYFQRKVELARFMLNRKA